MTTLLLSHGTPMLCGGDEMGRTQRGNNNAYAQDNEISWMNWELSDADRSLLEFTQRVARLRRSTRFSVAASFSGGEIRGSEVKDVTWLSSDGTEMNEDWTSGFVKCFGMWLGGEAMEEWNEEGEQVRDDDFLLLFNADEGPIPFTLPAVDAGERWTVVLDTHRPELAEGEEDVRAGDSLRSSPGR